jgi:hypothetical protein
MFSMMLVQASERRSSPGSPRRMTVRISLEFGLDKTLRPLD